MTPTTRRALTVLVWLAIVLLLAPPVLRMQADAGEIVPCPQMWTPERGVYGGCTVFLPVVTKCAECMSSWPVWPDGSR